MSHAAIANTKTITRTSHSMTNTTMNQSEFLIITFNLHKARETLRLKGAFSIASHCLKYCREIFKQVIKLSNRNRHLQTARRGKLNDGLRRRNQLQGCLEKSLK